MGFINVNLGEGVKEPEVAPEGNYLLRVANVQHKEAKSSGAPMIVVAHEIDGHPEYAPVYQNIVLPKEDDEADKVNFKLLNLKRYLHLAGVPFDEGGFEDSDLMGAEFEASVTVRTDESGQYGPQNELVVPRLPRE